MNPSSASIFSSSWVKNNSQIVSFLLCTLLAAIIWTVNSLNKIHTSTIDVTLNYDQTWLKAWSAGNQPRNVTVQISGRGFDLLKYYLKSSSPLVEINERSLFKGDKQVRTIEFLQPLVLSLGSTIKINNVTPEWIPLPAQKPFFKRVAVKPVYDLELNPAFIISGPAVCVPDSIWLSSSKPFPDSLKSVSPQVTTFTNVNHTIFTSAKLDLTSLSQILTEVKSVYIYIPVEEATERVIEVPLYINSSVGKHIQLVPAKISLTCRVPLSRYDKTIPGRFSVYANITSERQKKAVIEVHSFPYWCDRISVSPTTVDYFFINQQ